MAIVQDAYNLTDDILTKILTGEYRRISDICEVVKEDTKEESKE